MNRNFSKITFLIKQGGFKFVGVEDAFTNHLVYLDANNETELIERLQLFISNWGDQKYNLGFKVNKNSTKITNVQFDSSTKDVTTKAPPSQPAPPMNGSYMNEKQIEEKILSRLKEYQREQDLKRREEEIREKEKDLASGGKRLEMLITNHILPYFTKGATNVNDAHYIAPMQGQPKRAIFHNPYISKKEIIDEPINISDEDAPKVTEAFHIFCKYMTPDVMLQFAKKIDESPEIVGQLQMMLNA